MTIYSSTTLAELLDELEMGSPHMGAAIRERVTALQDELADYHERPEDGSDCPNCEENEAVAQEMAAKVDELEAKLKEVRS